MIEDHPFSDNLADNSQRLSAVVIEVGFSFWQFLIGLDDHVSNFEAVDGIYLHLRLLEFKDGGVDLGECQMLDLAVPHSDLLFLVLFEYGEKAVEFLGLYFFKFKLLV